MEQKVNTEHREIFDTLIYDYFENDINSCLLVSKTKQKCPKLFRFPGGLNFTAALTIFSIIDMMTAFYFGINPNKTDNNNSKNPSVEEVSKFLTTYFSKYYSQFRDREFGKYFYKVFRHGLVHNYSPKAAGVAMDFNSKELIGFDNKEKSIILNVPVFFDVTQKAFRDYDKNLSKGERIVEFRKHLEFIIEDNESDVSKLLKILNSVK